MYEPLRAGITALYTGAFGVLRVRDVSCVHRTRLRVCNYRLLSGHLPVVWTKRKYKMLYVNMGHGDKVMSTPEMRTIFESALLCLSKPAN